MGLDKKVIKDFVAAVNKKEETKTPTILTGTVHREGGKNTADNAASVASSASSAASTANSTANAAKSTAEGASKTASDAKSTADSASQVASNASSVAGAAKTTADNASKAASEANSTASTAKSTADQAKSTADTATKNFTALTKQVTEAETTIKKNKEEIELRAKKTEVTEAIDNIDIGGRNLLKGSHRTEQTYSYPTSDYQDYGRWITTTALNGDTYTLSFWAKSTVAGDVIRVHFYDPSNIISAKGSQGQSSHNSDGQCDFTLSTTLTKYWVTYKIPNAEKRLLIGLAHDRIIWLGMQYIERGWISQDEYENLHDYLFIPYSEAGGNGSAAKVMKDVDNLPVHKTGYKSKER